MDKIFQKICDLYPHYKINTKIKKKIFYIIFTLFKSVITGPIKLNFGNFFFYSYPQRKNYSRSLLSKVALHDEREINFFIKNIDDKSVFIDCGANQGFYTIPIAASNKSCKIIAFEPSIQEMEYLNQNILQYYCNCRHRYPTYNLQERFLIIVFLQQPQAWDTLRNHRI